MSNPKTDRKKFPKPQIARNLRRLLKAKNLRPCDLARTIDRNDVQIFQWMSGDYMPGAGALIALADALGVSLDVLVR